MGKRTKTHIKELVNIIISMRETEMTQQEIADDLNLTKLNFSMTMRVSRIKLDWRR